MPGLGDFLNNMFQPQQPMAQLPGQAFQDPMQGMGPVDRFSYLKQNNPESLMSLAAGLMNGNMGAGFAAAGDSMGQHRKEFMQQQEGQRKENLTKRWLMSNKGMSDEEATMAMSDPAILGTYLTKPGSDSMPASVQEFEYGQQNPAYAEWLKSKGRDAQLTTVDKRAILEADEMVQANDYAIDILGSVLNDQGAPGTSLNDRAGSGMTAGTQSWLARNDPTGFFDDSKGEATTELENVVIGQALASLKATFGAAPTEGERKILVDLQASIDKTPAERKIIIQRALKAAEARRQFNKQRADELRGGTFYRDGGGAQGSTVPPAAPGSMRQKYGLD